MAEETHRRNRAAVNGPRPSVDDCDTQPEPALLDQMKLLNLVLDHPHIQRALKRDAETDAAKHTLYDVMLAQAGLKEEWSEHEIIALIREGNTRSGRPAPGDEFCKLTIQEASVREKTGDLDLARESLLNNLSDIWGLNITAVIRHGTENALWHLRLFDGREIQIGTSKDLLSQAHVRAQIYDVTGKVIPRYKPSDARLWDHHMEILALVAVTVDTPEMTRIGQAKAFVRGYLEALHCELDRDADSTDWENLARLNRPYLKQGILYLSARHLWMHHVRIVAPKMIQTELLDLLRLLGGRRITIAIHDPKTTSRSVWRIPATSLAELPPQEGSLKGLSEFNLEVPASA